MAVSRSVAETERLTQVYLTNLVAKRDRATVLGLSGELGSGKTVFTQALARELGVVENITSPTFVLEKIYKLNNQKFARLVHVDAYRLESGKELLKLGFAELLLDKNNLIVIEWAERVRDILGDFRKVDFRFIDEKTREISW